MDQVSNIPEELNLSNINKVIVVEVTRTDGGTQKTTHIGTLESLTLIGEGLWIANLSGDIHLQPDIRGLCHYEVVHVQEAPKPIIFTQNNH